MDHEKSTIDYEKNSEVKSLSGLSEQEILDMTRRDLKKTIESAKRDKQANVVKERMNNRAPAFIIQKDDSYFHAREEKIRKGLDDTQWMRMQKDYKGFIDEGGDIDNNDVSCQVYDFLHINGFSKENAPALFQKRLSTEMGLSSGNEEINDICIRDISAIPIPELHGKDSISLIGALSYLYADKERWNWLSENYVDQASDILSLIRLESEGREMEMPRLDKREDGYAIQKDFRHRLIFLMTTLEMELAKNPDKKEDILKKYTIRCKVG